MINMPGTSVPNDRSSGKVFPEELILLWGEDKFLLFFNEAVRIRREAWESAKKVNPNINSIDPTPSVELVIATGVQFCLDAIQMHIALRGSTTPDEGQDKGDKDGNESIV